MGQDELILEPEFDGKFSFENTQVIIRATVGINLRTTDLLFLWRFMRVHANGFGYCQNKGLVFDPVDTLRREVRVDYYYFWFSLLGYLLQQNRSAPSPKQPNLSLALIYFRRLKA
ncbi:uncharacterized protein LOC122075098 isoform X2 [Macadamia integrifolia]|uniref:uncharacterized protein LOC122075098 isoform X2 n=1 Tax=Macadamia integrifolia TaxID=60698 RepID=UPI001C4F10C6|nr:uncharacterized protein LOC122075098 isoform X2 [Macadamia integrifolia]